MTKPCCLPLREHRLGQRPKPAEINRKQRENGAELDQDCKRFTEGIISPAEQVLHQEQMASRGHRKVFGQALDDTEHCRLDKVEMHELLRKFADAVCGR